MRRKHLESTLQSLRGFARPRLELEQYATTPELAADILLTINDDVGLECGIDGAGEKLIGDLGCGCGVFMVGVAEFGHHHIIGIDVDDEALRICRKNILENSSSYCDLVRADVIAKQQQTGGGMASYFRGKFDVVVTNPPFGTKNNAGIDWKFVEEGIAMLQADGCLYSLHKRARREFLRRQVSKQANPWASHIEAECVAELQWDLQKTYKHQKRESLDIEVDLWRFSKVAEEGH